ncbi:MAG TPA: LPS export ABC transporter periplasmic protein LptC [Gammaproteobacteria bacterium]|nr:LPS export ABC transporter periplasmic protein LptC [Gammaproteobacteria bacterium]
MDRRTLLRGVLLALVLAVGGYLLFRMTQQGQGSREPPGPQATHRPDYFLGDAHIEQTGANGRILYSVDARRMEHYPADGHTELTAVRLTWHAAGHPPWTLTADRATVPKSRKRVELRGHVHGRYLQQAGGVPVTLSTPSLTVLVDKQVAETDSGARIVQGSSRITARRLHADLKTGVIRLQHQVEGTYAP